MIGTRPSEEDIMNLRMCRRGGIVEIKEMRLIVELAKISAQYLTFIRLMIDTFLVVGFADPSPVARVRRYAKIIRGLASESH